MDEDERNSDEDYIIAVIGNVQPKEPDIPDEDGPRDLTSEEAEIVDQQLNSGATETGVTL